MARPVCIRKPSAPRRSGRTFGEGPAHIMTKLTGDRRKWLIVEVLGICVFGIGLCFALASIGVHYSEERLAKEKRQVATKMDEMRGALTTAKVPAEQIPGLLRVHKAALVRETTNEHFIILSFLILLSLLVSSVGVIVTLWAKLRALSPPNPALQATAAPPGT